MEQVKFTKMEDGDAEDYLFLNDHETEYTKGTANPIPAAPPATPPALAKKKIKLTKLKMIM